MDQGDPRNSAAEELPISDMRADAYTRTSGTRLEDPCDRVRKIIHQAYKKQRL